MKFRIVSESTGRMRIHVLQSRMTYGQADTLLYFLHNRSEISSAKVYDRTCDAAINYHGSRKKIIHALQRFHYEDVEIPTIVAQLSRQKSKIFIMN